MYLAKCLPTPDDASRSAEYAEYNLVIDELIAENGILVTPPPFYEYFNHYPEKQVDGLHPNGAGYNGMGQLWFNAIMGYNNAPDAVDDANIDVAMNSGANSIDVLANDFDIDGDTLQISSIGTPANGAAVLNDNGTPETGDDYIDYTPDVDFFGADSFTYEISDGNGGTDTAVVTINVVEPNTAPTAVDDAYGIVEQNSTDNVLDVLTNDYDDNGDALTISAVGAPSHGTAVVDPSGSATNPGTDDVILYTPDADYSGPDSFTYEISDGNGGVDTATVTLTVNTPPTAVADDYPAVAQNTTDNILDVLANDSDDDGDALFISGVSAAANGTVSIDPSGSATNPGPVDVILYTPDADFTGADSFTYEISDGNGGIDTTTVTITVI